MNIRRFLLTALGLLALAPALVAATAGPLVAANPPLAGSEGPP